MTKVECSLCGQPFDEDAEIQKERHKDKHDAKIKTASSNRDTRKLEWVPIGTKKPMYEKASEGMYDWVTPVELPPDVSTGDGWKVSSSIIAWVCNICGKHLPKSEAPHYHLYKEHSDILSKSELMTSSKWSKGDTFLDFTESYSTEDDWHIKNRNYKPDGTLSKMQGFPISKMKTRSDALRLQVEIESEIEKEIAGEFNEDDRDRVPAGQPNGGQWVKGSGSGSSSSDDSSRNFGDVYGDVSENEKEEFTRVIFNVADDYDKEEYLDTIGKEGEYFEDMEFDDLDFDTQEELMTEFDEDGKLEEEWKKTQPAKSPAFDYDSGKPKDQDEKSALSWSWRLDGVGRSHHQATTKGIDRKVRPAKIPNYPKVEQISVKEYEEKINDLGELENYKMPYEIAKKAYKDTFDYAMNNIDSLKIDTDSFAWSSMKFMMERELKYDMKTGEQVPLFTEKEMNDEKFLKEMFINRAFNPNIRGNDFVSVSDRADTLRNFSTLMTENPKLKEIFEPANEQPNKINKKHYDLFLEAPEFYRGTTLAELDEYLDTGKLGGSKNKYDFVALTMDRKQAVGDARGKADRIVVIFEGDEIRKVALPVQYSALPYETNFGYGDIAEQIDTPVPINFMREREVRTNEDIDIPKISSINFGDDWTEERKEEYRKKYSSLVDGDSSRITFEEFRGEVGNQVAKSEIIGSNITKMKFLEPETRLAKQRMNDSQIGFKKYLNDISWS